MPVADRKCTKLLVKAVSGNIFSVENAEQNEALLR